MIYSDGNSYEGSWLNDKKHGHGKFIWLDASTQQTIGVYEGNFENDMISG